MIAHYLINNVTKEQKHIIRDKNTPIENTYFTLFKT
jgi:hypothetical protein